MWLKKNLYHIIDEQTDEQTDENVHENNMHVDELNYSQHSGHVYVLFFLHCRIGCVNLLR